MSRYLFSSITALIGGFFGVFFGQECHGKFCKNPEPNNLKLSKVDEYKHAMINVAKLYIAKIIGGSIGILFGAFIGWKSFPLLQNSPQFFYHVFK